MDPDTVWQAIVENLRALEKNPQDTEARENVVADLGILTRWLHNGGYPPDVMKSCAQMVAQEVLQNPIFKEKAE